MSGDDGGGTDGKAEVIFGLRDGRVIGYRTGMAYQAQWAQWPTVNGSFQHTGAWTAKR